MTALVCLCGAPLWQGLRPARPGFETSLWIMSLDAAAAWLAAQRAEEILAAERAAASTRLLEAATALKRLERRIGKLLKTSSRGRLWALPERQAATRGRDGMVLALQEKGYTFRQARKLVKQFWAVVRDLLLAGKKVDTPIGSLSVRPAPPVQSRERFSTKQVLFRRRRRIVFRPKEAKETVRKWDGVHGFQAAGPTAL